MPAKIEEKFRKFCKELKSKENRLCYFLGGTADAATGQIITNSFILFNQALFTYYISYTRFLYFITFSDAWNFHEFFYVNDYKVSNKCIC